jgi:hypothetical protein
LHEVTLTLFMSVVPRQVAVTVYAPGVDAEKFALVPPFTTIRVPPLALHTETMGWHPNMPRQYIAVK